MPEVTKKEGLSIPAESQIAQHYLYSYTEGRSDMSNSQSCSLVLFVYNLLIEQPELSNY